MNTPQLRRCYGVDDRGCPYNAYAAPFKRYCNECQPVRLCPGPPEGNGCPNHNEKLPWDGYCKDCRNAAQRRRQRIRYRKLREAQGRKVYGRDERLADAQLNTTTTVTVEGLPEGADPDDWRTWGSFEHYTPAMWERYDEIEGKALLDRLPPKVDE